MLRFVSCVLLGYVTVWLVVQLYKIRMSPTHLISVTYDVFRLQCDCWTWYIHSTMSMICTRQGREWKHWNRIIFSNYPPVCSYKLENSDGVVKIFMMVQWRVDAPCLAPCDFWQIDKLCLSKALCYMDWLWSDGMGSGSYLRDMKHRNPMKSQLYCKLSSQIGREDDCSQFM